MNESALVLVTVVPRRRDLEIARLLGWYRIPLKTAPKVISVDYLAFYQTAAFDEADRWQIQFTAPVLGHELTTRAQLLLEETDHPRANEEYFKLALGPLNPLPHPIPSIAWKRITFFYTTGRHMQTAKSLQDLVVRDDERQVLWHSLRERALSSQEYKADQLPKLPIDPAILALLGFFHKNTKD